MVQPVASPSLPSVRLTALEAPTIAVDRLLEERHHQLAHQLPEFGNAAQTPDGESGDQKLPGELGPPRNAVAPFVDHLHEVVGKADQTEGGGGDDQRNGDGIGHDVPEQRGDQNRPDQQDSAHAGGAVLLLVDEFRRDESFKAAGGLRVEPPQLPRGEPAEQHDQQKRGERGAARTECNIIEQTERTEVPAQQGEKIQHGYCL